MMLAYLDPVSWFAALQMGGVGMAWIIARTRRLLPAAFNRRTHSVESVRVKGAIGAVAELTQPSARPRLVVILEGPRDWPYVGPAVAALGDVGEREVWIVSRGDLPLESLKQLPFAVRAVADIGLALWVTLASRLHADGVVTTITDLGTTAFAKSPFTRYVYLFHSLMSTHVSYSSGAFDAYDLLLCPSITHVQELHYRDRRLGRPERCAIEVGYPVLQSLQTHFSALPDFGKVVIAPSWSADHLFSSTWTDLVDAMVATGWRVSVRPHPETVKRSPSVIASITKRYAGSSKVDIDLSAGSGDGIGNPSALVTDWSGIGTEVALAGRPVIFVDTQRKVRNPDWALDGARSIEADARTLVGTVVDPAKIGEIPRILAEWRPDSASAGAFRRQVVSSIAAPGPVAASEIRKFIGWTV